MTPRSRRLTALTATAAIAAAVVVGTSGSVPTGAAPAAAAEGRRVTTGAAATSGTVDTARTPDRPAPATRPAADAVAAPAPSPAAAERQTPSAAAPTRQLTDRDRQGRDALRALGDQVGEVAARNRVSEQQLVRTLTQDDTAWLTTQGEVYFQEPMPSTVQGPVAGAVTPTNVDASRTFSLHSRPGARLSIVIDVDGASVRDTAWNTRPANPLPNGDWAGWSSDSDPRTFSGTEHAWIQEVWRQVSEAYAAFDIDVTTDSRDDNVWRRSDASDTTYGTRVVVTTSATPADTLCPSGCVGQAFLGTFGRADRQTLNPAFVFARSTMSPIVAAQTVTHEAGHTFGLSHDGNATSEYHAGTPLWGPIMGAGMIRAISQWSPGDYAGATQKEDDVATIAALAPLVADEAGNTATEARALPAGASYDVDGVISARTDKDVYRLDLTCATTVTAKVTGIGAQAALDLRLDLLSSSAALLASDAPDTSLRAWPSTAAGQDAAVTQALTPGTYYLRVDGVGDDGGVGSNWNQPAWSDYGSLGRYRLQANGCTGETPVTTQPTATPSPAPTTPAPAPATAPVTLPVMTPPAAGTPTSSAPVVLSRPGAPIIGTATSGTSGGTVSATVRWTAPRSTGGQVLRGYKLRAMRLDSRNRVVATYTSARVSAAVRTLVWRLPKGRYTFVAQAENGLGASVWSARSRVVTAR